MKNIKGSSAKIRSCTDDVDKDVMTMRNLVKWYQDRLQAAVVDVPEGRKPAASY